MEEREKDQLIQTKSQCSKGTLKIVHFSDTHNRHKQVKIPECDILIFSGDLSSMGNKSEVESFLNWISKQVQCTTKCIVAGNHDITFDEMKFSEKHKPEWLCELLDQYDDYGLSDRNFYLQNEMKNVMGVNIWGSPYSSWFNGETWAFNVHRGKDSAELYSTIPLGADIVITHGPPLGENDWCRDVAGPIGCKDLAYHIKRVKPLLHLYGHIHEAYGHSYDKDTHYFNGAICNLSYEAVNAPWLIEANFDRKEVIILNYEKK